MESDVFHSSLKGLAQEVFKSRFSSKMILPNEVQKLGNMIRENPPMKNSVESLFSSSTIGSFGATLLLKSVQGDKRPKPCAGPSGNVMGLAHDQTAPSPSHRQRVKSSALGLTLRPLSMTPTQLGSRGQLQRVWSKAVRRRGFSSITSCHGTSTVAGTEQKLS